MSRTFRSSEDVPIPSVPLGDGRPLTITVRRMTVTEYAAFDRQMHRLIYPDTNRLLLVRHPGEEQERDQRSAITEDELAAFEAQLTDLQSPEGLLLEPKERATRAIAITLALMSVVRPTERFVISDVEICRRRLLDLTEAQQRTYEKLKALEDQTFEQCAREAIPKYVTVPAGQIRMEKDGVESDVTSGEDLLFCLGVIPAAIFDVLFAIKRVNSLHGDAKNDSRSRSTSTPGSTSSDRTVLGDLPATTAEPASGSGSATTAAATPIGESPSGPTVN